MAHTYMLFDFGADEEKAQQARHKLENWKQAFRLDKKLQYKLDRGESPAPEAPEAEEKPKTKTAAKSKSKTGAKAKPEAATQKQNGTVKLLVRLYFSGHEKLSEQRWLDRIPAEEPFKDAAPQVINEKQPEFQDTVQKFDSLE
jgi:hypothetical protein